MTNPDDRMALARAYSRATSVATIAIGMAAPPLVGHFADNRFGTKIVFTVLGAAFGLTYGIWHLMKLADPKRANTAQTRTPNQMRTEATWSAHNAG